MLHRGVQQLVTGISRRAKCSSFICIRTHDCRADKLRRVRSRRIHSVVGSVSGVPTNTMSKDTRHHMGRTVSHPQGATRSYHVDTDKETVKENKAKFAKMTPEEKRNLYKCGGDFKTLDQVPTWPEYASNMKVRSPKKSKLLKEFRAKPDKPVSVNDKLNQKMSIWRGDITVLEIDAIGNAANSTLMGGGGVDGCIHRAAGSYLKKECSLLDGCKTGDAKITSGYKLPAKHVIHTVGPMGENRSKLESCYERCLEILTENNLRSLAMPCVSTGIYGYPSEKAAPVVIGTVRKWLETKNNADLVDRIIFCLFLKEDVRLYEEYMAAYFPLKGPDNDTGRKETNSKEDVEDVEDVKSDDAPVAEDRSPKAKVAKTEKDNGKEEQPKEEVVAKSDGASDESGVKVEGTQEGESKDGVDGEIAEEEISKDATGAETAAPNSESGNVSAEKARGEETCEEGLKDETEVGETLQESRPVGVSDQEETEDRTDVDVDSDDAQDKEKAAVKS